MPVTREIAKANGMKGGRPKGEATKLTRTLANELCRQGLDGLSGMVENMLFWRDKARELGDLLEEQLKSSDPEIQKEALRTVGPFLAARQNHHECARDVAPYTNPRLQAITISKTSTHTEIRMELPKPSEEKPAERIYREGNVVGLKRA